MMNNWLEMSLKGSVTSKPGKINDIVIMVGFSIVLFYGNTTVLFCKAQLFFYVIFGHLHIRCIKTYAHRRVLMQILLSSDQRSFQSRSRKVFMVFPALAVIYHVCHQNLTLTRQLLFSMERIVLWLMVNTRGPHQNKWGIIYSHYHEWNQHNKTRSV